MQSVFLVVLVLQCLFQQSGKSIRFQSNLQKIIGKTQRADVWEAGSEWPSIFYSSNWAMEFNFPTSSLVFLDSTRSQSPIMLRTAAKYAKPTRIQNHTSGLYHFMYSILRFPPDRERNVIKKYRRDGQTVPAAKCTTCLRHSRRFPLWLEWSPQSRWPPEWSNPRCVWRRQRGWRRRRCSQQVWREWWTSPWSWSGWSVCVFADKRKEKTTTGVNSAPVPDGRRRLQTKWGEKWLEPLKKGSLEV